MAGSQFLTPPFDARETLFYKSVTHVVRLFVFLPIASAQWQKQKGFSERILLL